jgi:hypothetical protein
MKLKDNLIMDRFKLILMPTSEAALAEDRQQKKCKTCKNYSFYHCKVTNKMCGPDGSCDQLKGYLVKGD